MPEDGSGRFGESARCRSGAARPVALCTHAGSRVCVCVMICVSFVRAGLLHVYSTVFLFRELPYRTLSPGCRVAGCCRVGLPGCRGVAGSVPGCRVLPGAGVLPGAAGVLPGAAGCCQAVRTCVHFRVLPGAAGCCRVAGLPGAAGLPGCAVGALVGLCPSCRVAHHETHLRERSLSDW